MRTNDDAQLRAVATSSDTCLLLANRGPELLPPVRYAPTHKCRKRGQVNSTPTCLLSIRDSNALHFSSVCRCGRHNVALRGTVGNRAAINMADCSGIKPDCQGEMFRGFTSSVNARVRSIPRPLIHRAARNQGSWNRRGRPRSPAPAVRQAFPLSARLGQNMVLHRCQYRSPFLTMVPFCSGAGCRIFQQLLRPAHRNTVAD